LCVGLVGGNQYEVSDTFDELKVVGIPVRKRGKSWHPGLHHVLLLSTGPLFHAGKFVSKLAYVREVTNYGKMVCSQIQTLILVMNIYRKTNDPFPDVMFKQAIQ